MPRSKNIKGFSY